MEAKHKAEIEGEASLYDKQLAKRDAAKSGNPPP
jgi:hypothetical protein